MTRSDAPPPEDGKRPAASHGPASARTDALGGSWMGATAPGELEDPLVGATLAKTYEIVGVLGEGGMGRVFEARHTRIRNKRFAVKVLHAELTREREVLVRFQREAEAAAAISHPNVVGVYDVDRTRDGRPYLVCEYLEGIELADRIRQSGPLPAAMVVRIARQVCQAVEAAHAQGVVHRDLKPQNIFLTGSPAHPQVKVLDFGLSTFLDRSDTAVTRAGVILGTPAYMSPEQARAERVDHRADIYGVGTILYAGLTGQPPFERPSAQLTVVAVMAEEPTRPRAIVPAIPAGLELIVQHAMANDPDYRYQTVTELNRALEPFDQLDPRARDVMPLARTSQPSRAGTSTSSLEVAAHDVATARTQLALYFALVVVAVMTGLATALAPVVNLATGATLSKAEFALVIAAFAGTFLTPAVLLVRHVLRRVWHNTAKVLRLLAAVRPPLFVGLAAYGGAALLVRTLDSVVAQFLDTPLIGEEHGTDWPGWSAMFLVVALLCSGATVLRSSMLRRAGKRWLRSVLAGPLFTATTLLLALGIIYQGLVWRGDETGDDPLATMPPEPLPGADLATDEERASPPGAPSASAAATAVELAPPSELAAAVGHGVAGLEPLAERYPDDPAVLKPLALAHAKKESGYAAAVEVAERLFAASPDQVDDSKLRAMLVQVAQGPTEPAVQAIELMSSKMGSTGPDILYDLMITNKKMRDGLRTRLADPEVRKLFNPALAVAYDLRTAESCAARVPLLPKAEEVGDGRAVVVLSWLGNGSRRGCGWRRRQRCKPQCPDESALFRQTTRKITARLKQDQARHPD